MRAAVLREPHRFEIVERPMPVLAHGDMLVRVRMAGICGSDVHLYRGEYVPEQLPRVPGHEFAGEVVEIRGPSADVAVGDLVTADINVGCGHCSHCTAGDPMLCATVRQIGIHLDGAFAEYVVVPTRQAIRLPPGTPPQLGALIEPAGCVTRSLRRCGLRAGQSLLVIGAGPMGMLHIQLAKAIGASPIVVVELDHKRSTTAKRHGADVAVGSFEMARSVADEISDGRGFDVVAECVGKSNLYEFGIELVRPGGVLAFFGWEQSDRTARFASYDIVMKEKTLVGSVGANGSDMRAAFELITENSIDVSHFTDCAFDLVDIDRALNAFAVDKIALKVQIAC